MDAGSRRNTKPYYLLAYLKNGSATVEQDGRETFVGIGNFVVVDTSRPFRIDTPAMQTNAVDISAAHMREIFPQIEALTSICIAGHSGPGAMLRNLLNDVFDHASEMHEEAFELVADAIPYLTAGALATLPTANDALPNRTEFHHRSRIRRFVRSNLRNRDLSPELIARSCGLSLRYVHQLFANEPATLMQWVWQERVARCGDDLLKRALRSRTVSEIAYSWGFNDPAHFSRLFRAQFGRSPRVFRSECGC
jgi:AraC family transcriptional activator of tynA and feaB